MLPPATSPPVDILTFRLGSQLLGLLGETVQEIVPAVAIEPLPSAPQVVLGVFNLRGTVTAVMDARERFRFPAQPLRLSDHFIVCRYDSRQVALRVDHVEGFIRCEPAAIQPTAAIADHTPHIAGVVVLADGMLLIHDLPTFLTESEAAALDAALEQWNSTGEHG